MASPAQIAALRAKVEPVYQWLREDATTAGFLDRIQRLSDTVPVDQAYQAPIDCTAAVQNQAPTPAAAATPSVTAPQAPTPVDGTYTITVTVEDVEAAGTPAGQVLAENWGESVFVFDRGRFATTTHNDQACIWAYGRFALNGDTMIWDFEDGGGQAPNNAANKPGEEFGFNWSLYRDVLTLTKKEGMVSPVYGSQWEFQQVSSHPGPVRAEPAVPAAGRGVPEHPALSGDSTVKTTCFADSLRGDGGHDRGALPRGAADAEVAAESFDPVDEPTQAAAGRGVGTAGAVIADARPDLRVLPADIDHDARGRCVLGDVGQGLRAHEIHAGLHRRRRSIHPHRQRDRHR